MRSSRLAPTLLLLLAGGLGAPATAEVRRIDVQSRAPFAHGRIFGDVGAYELLRGRILYAVDPNHPANAAVVDLRRAPRTARGQVLFWGDFELLKPVDFARGNRRLFYDVTNRGNKVLLGQMNDAGGNTPAPGNGFLFRAGYSILWTGWNWDVTPGGGRLQIELPEATGPAGPLRQRIAVEMVLSYEEGEVWSRPVCWGNARCYPAVDVSPASPAQLTVRDTPRGERETIPRGRWRWGRRVNGQLEPSRTWITLDGGFAHGRIYELVYEVQDPPVVGLGLAAVRDAVAFFHFATADEAGTQNPLALTGEDGTKCSGVERAYAWGTSQSGRFLVHMLWQGFHVDEADRLVFEGVIVHAAGGGKGGFNHRFAQTSQHPSHLEGNGMPADHPPFWFLPDSHPRSGSLDDVLAVAKERARMPRIFLVQNELEYWTRAASLVHTTLDGSADVPLHHSVRLYVASAAPHGASPSRTPGVHEHPRNPLDTRPLLRALVGHLDRWATEDFAPPPSRYPRLADGTLVPVSVHEASFPAIPGAWHPGTCYAPARLGLGPRFWTEGIADAVPPVLGESYRTLVPACDADGNGRGGVRLPDVAVPLATYTGWNPRHPRYGAAGFLGRYDGSSWPLPRDEEARARTADPRPSIVARHGDQARYVELVKECGTRLVDEGFLLGADAEAYAARAAALVWPPEPRDEAPFWAVRSD